MGLFTTARDTLQRLPALIQERSPSWSGLREHTGALRERTDAQLDRARSTASTAREHLGDSAAALGDRFDTLWALISDRAGALFGEAASEREQIEQGLRRLNLLSTVLDDLVPLPLTSRRVGLDPVLSRIPVIRRVAPPAIAAYSLFEAARMGAPPMVLVRMVGRHALDFIGGRVPMAGVFFSAYYKSYRLNLADLIAHFEQSLGELEEAPEPETLERSAPEAADADGETNGGKKRRFFAFRRRD